MIFTHTFLASRGSEQAEVCGEQAVRDEQAEIRGDLAVRDEQAIRGEPGVPSMEATCDEVAGYG